MKTPWKPVLPLLGLLCLAAPQARSQIDSPTLLQSASVTGAGAVHLSNGTLIVRGTLAQPAIGSLRVGANTTNLGFWHPLSRTTGMTRTEDPTTGSGMLALQATPNPFAGSTKIALKIPQAGRVSLVLYDLIGQPVTTLIDTERPEGEYSIDLNADELASGHYTLILDTANERRTISLLLLR